MRTAFRLWTAGLVAVMLAGVPLNASAGRAPNAPAQTEGQVEDALAYDTPVEGAIDDQTFSESWTLQADSADRIAIQVERLSGNLIPDVQLLDAGGATLQSSRGADATRAVARIDRFALPSGGAYQVVVGRVGGETGPTSGTYRLTVTLHAVAEDHPDNAAVLGPIALDAPVTGAITPSHWQHRYTLDAEAGDAIVVRATRLSGTLLPQVQVLDSNNASLTTASTDLGGARAETSRLTLPTTASYTVLVQRERGFTGATAGSYELVVALLGSGEASPRLTGATPGVIEAYDVPVSGEISNAHWYQDWRITTLAADSVALIVSRSPDDAPEAPNRLRPEVMVLGGAGQVLRQGTTDETGAMAAIERFTFDGPGTYTVRVARQGGKTGQTVGTYALTVRLIGSGQDSPLLKEPPQPIDLGTPVEGEITNAAWLQAWTFQGQAGQRVSAVVTRTDGTLVPAVQIQDINGQQLRSAGPDNTADRAALAAFALPAGAQYRVVVLRDGGRDGLTEGAYSLLLEAEATQ